MHAVCRIRDSLAAIDAVSLRYAGLARKFARAEKRLKNYEVTKVFE